MSAIVEDVAVVVERLRMLDEALSDLTEPMQYAVVRTFLNRMDPVVVGSHFAAALMGAVEFYLDSAGEGEVILDPHLQAQVTSVQRRVTELVTGMRAPGTLQPTTEEGKKALGIAQAAKMVEVARVHSQVASQTPSDAEGDS